MVIMGLCEQEAPITVAAREEVEEQRYKEVTKRVKNSEVPTIGYVYRFRIRRRCPRSNAHVATWLAEPSRDAPPWGQSSSR